MSDATLSGPTRAMQSAPGTAGRDFHPSDDQLWAAVSALRLATADLLAQLSDSELDSPSLCADWSVREVAAHLTLQGIDLRKALAMVARYYRGGGMNALSRRAAQQKAQQVPFPRLLSELRALAVNPRPNLGVPKIGALFEALAHAQDIAIPLGREFPVDPLVAAWSATGAIEIRDRDRFKVVGPPPLIDVTLTATDIDWSMGEGPEVRGPMLALFLVTVGRTATLGRLEGPSDTLDQARHSN